MRNRGRVALIGASMILSLLIVGSTTAEAALFKGKSSQGEHVGLRTDGNGLPTRLQFKKFTAPCEHGGFFRDRGFAFIPPFDAVSESRLFGAGTLRVRAGRATYLYKSRMIAKRRSSTRWSGLLRIKILIMHGGELQTTCKNRIGFRVTLAR